MNNFAECRNPTVDGIQTILVGEENMQRRTILNSFTAKCYRPQRRSGCLNRGDLILALNAVFNMKQELDESFPIAAWVSLYQCVRGKIYDFVWYRRFGALKVVNLESECSEKSHVYSLTPLTEPNAQTSSNPIRRKNILDSTVPRQFYFILNSLCDELTTSKSRLQEINLKHRKNYNVAGMEKPRNATKEDHGFFRHSASLMCRWIGAARRHLRYEPPAPSCVRAPYSRWKDVRIDIKPPLAGSHSRTRKRRRNRHKSLCGRLPE